jgi:hypothetical protein
MRWQSSELVAIDAWRVRQDEKPSRADAIRRLVKIALSGAGSRPQAEMASELAAGAAERILDKSLPAEEQQRRKRALIKGPKEFRDIREDLPKSKT